MYHKSASVLLFASNLAVTNAVSRSNSSRLSVSVASAKSLSSTASCNSQFL